MRYVYVDWTTDETAYPFYVGQGDLRRVHRKHRNTFHSNIAQKHGVRREVVFSSEDPKEVSAEEVRLIAELKTFNGDNPKGANFTRGGEGTLGKRTPLSEETKEKLRQSLLGRTMSKESSEKKSRALLGKPHIRKEFTDEERERLYESRRGRYLLTPEQHEARVEKLRGRKRAPFSEETRTKMSLAAKERCRRQKESQS